MSDSGAGFPSLKRVSVSIQILRDRNVHLLGNYLPLNTFLSGCTVIAVSRYSDDPVAGPSRCLRVTATCRHVTVRVHLPYFHSLCTTTTAEADTLRLSFSHSPPKYHTFLTASLLHLADVTLPYSVLASMPSLSPVVNLRRLQVLL